MEVKEIFIVRVEEENRSSHDKANYKYTFRLITFEIDPDYGARSVCDIVEQSGNTLKELSFAYYVKGVEDSYTLSEVHKDVDFGRAKLLGSKIDKIVKELM